MDNRKHATALPGHDAHMTTKPHTTTLTTLLALPPDLVERDRVRRQALRAGSVRHDGLAPLREAAFAGEGLALTWEIPVAADALAAGPQAVSALAPVAAGLALLHDAGLAHGGITEAAVHVHEGRGVLSGWRPGGTAQGDVADLIALLDRCLPPASVGADIAQLLIEGTDPDPLTRPSMGRIAAALDRAATAHAPLLSPPAHRRARLTDAPPPRLAEPAPAVEPARTMPVATRRGRHAAHRVPAGSLAGRPLPLRMPWRWGVALAGAAAVAFLGLSALGTAGSAQEICPATADQSAWGSLVHRGLAG